MIVRFPGPDRENDPSWQAETEAQPDPMLRADPDASPVMLAVAAVLGLAIVSMVFYGLTREPAPGTSSTASSSPTAGMTTSGQAPATGANAPSPSNQLNSGTGQSGQAQPADQEQGIPPGQSGENR